MTSDDGSFNLPNVLPGSYDVKVSLQGFREFVKTGVPVTAGTVSRVEVALEVGALTETVTVASAVQLLQTDKADVHTELKAKEIVNLPLNQYRNYQTLINLVPGATPAAFQNDQTDTPGRSLRTFVNGTNPNNNNTRLDGASSVNIWLPHHVGYVQPAETIDTVNISTNNFDAGQGMAGGAAITLVTKSGTNDLKGSAFDFRNQDELNAQPFFDPTKLDSSISIGGGTVGGPIEKNRLFFFGSYEGNYERTSRFDIYTVPTAKMRNGDFSEVLGDQPELPALRPADGQRRRHGPDAVCRTTSIPANRISSDRADDSGALPGAEQRRHEQRPAEQPVPGARRRRPIATTTTRRSTGTARERTRSSGKFSTMQAQVVERLQLGFDGGGVGDTKVYVATVGHTWTLSPTLLLDGNFGSNRQDQTVQASDFGTNFGTDVFGIPGTNGPDIRGRAACRRSTPGCSGDRQRRRRGPARAARDAATRSRRT